MEIETKGDINSSQHNALSFISTYIRSQTFVTLNAVVLCFDWMRQDSNQINLSSFECRNPEEMWIQMCLGKKQA